MAAARPAPISPARRMAATAGRSISCAAATRSMSSTRSARGRAAQWSQAQGPVSAANLKRVLQRFVAPEREKLWPQAERHTQWPGAGSPGDATFEQFYMSQFPSLIDYPRQQEINSLAGVALLDKIGPAVLLTHSQSGAFAWPIADRRPDLVKAIVAVEPNGPPVHETQFKGAPEWFADSRASSSAGLGESLAYEPPLHAGEQLAFVRQDEPERSDLVRCWSQAEPARKLTKLANIPVLVVVAEASYHAAYDHCTVNYLRQAGVKTEFVRLAERGHHRQRPHDDAGEEQRRHRGPHGRLARQDAAGRPEAVRLRPLRIKRSAAIEVDDATVQTELRHFDRLVSCLEDRRLPVGLLA